MTKIIFVLLISFCGQAFAEHLTPAQILTLRAAIYAETDSEFVGYRTSGATGAMQEWLARPGATDSWNERCSGQTLFEATDVTKFDGLSAGKREAWRLMLSFAPIDYTHTNPRAATVDAWGNVNSVAILQQCRRKASHAEAYFGGTVTVTNTVSAIILTAPGTLSQNEFLLAYTL